uniref:Uncharacterized protein n=1 Tax=Panagrolaimus sp. PS1159 TaxID=55785 RepID=A0AC35EXT5_9BILA
MFPRTVLMTSKIVQNQGPVRLINASAVTMKDKTIIEQAKEGAHNITEKAKEVLEKAKEAVAHPGKTVSEAYDQVKESAQNLTGNNPTHDSHQNKQSHGKPDTSAKQKVATEKSDVKDAYDAKLH